MRDSENGINFVVRKKRLELIYPETYERKIGFEPVRERLAALCVSSAGRREVPLMGFLTDYNAISHALDATAEMLALSAAGNDFPLGGLHDIEPVLRRARVQGAVIPAEEFRQVRRTLGAVAEACSFLKSTYGEDGATTCPALCAEAAELRPFPEVTRAIDRVLDEGGNVRDNASAELSRIRSELARISGTVNSIMRRVMARAVADGYLEPDAAPSVRDGRLVLPVSPMNKRRISGIVHDESASGKTFYIEPAEVVEVNNRSRELEIEERREVLRILAELTAELRPEIELVLDCCAVMGRLDFIHAKALYAARTGGVLPHLSEKPELELYHAVHPVLLESLARKGQEVVPLDIILTPSKRLLVISGPNAGGKSVCLKTVGALQYMLQCGMLPPVYENSHMGVFDDIFIDIGDDQSIENDLSTYSSHLRNMREFLRHGRRTSLVLVDEFGGGTEPQIGGAIAQAILKVFNDKGMWGVITTHYQNLKHLADETEGLVNGSMLYDRQQMRPLFRLSIGSPGSSFALEIARKTGLPADVLADAEEIAGSDYVNMDRYLLDIARDRRYWENKRQAIRQKEKKLEETLARYENDAETLRQHRREILAEAKEEARKILDGSNASIERAIREIRESQADRERTQAARLALQHEKADILKDKASDNRLLRKAPKARHKEPEKKPADMQKPLAVGDTVRLDGQGTPGKILDISGKNATVAFGMLKTQVKLQRLQRTLQQPSSGAREGASFVSASTVNSMRDRQLEFSREIDVRGMRADEAIQAVTYFLDDAIQFSQGQVRVLHGTGTGALRQAIRQYIDTVPGVESYRDEDVRFGGAGITVITLS